jgi:hypothetical protein
LTSAALQAHYDERFGNVFQEMQMIVQVRYRVDEKLGDVCIGRAIALIAGFA